MANAIVIIGTLDTKWQEISYLKELIEQMGHHVILLDISTRSDSPIKVDITREEVARAGGINIEETASGSRHRDEITAAFIRGAIVKVTELLQSDNLGGIIGVGGVSNTAMVTEVMQSLPYGIPKLMVSSGAAMPQYAGGFFGSSDITIFSSVVDIDGLHLLSKSVLQRAAGAICGMVKTSMGSVVTTLKQSEKPLIALTQFQYSTECCEIVRRKMEEEGYTVIPCHANGIGDKAMERLIAEDIFNGVIDIVPGGVSEQIFGGNRAAGSVRLESAGRQGLPQVITPCGFEMISCGPISRKDTNDPLWISRNITERKYYIQDAYRVQARTTKEELETIAKVVSDKLNQSMGPIIFMVPLKGWSSLSEKGQPLYDKDADTFFMEELRNKLKPEIDIIKLDFPLNSTEFADAIVKAFTNMIGARKSA